jgi:hypothetical protein
MSLKAFHIVFIAASLVLALGFAVWSLAGYVRDRQARDLICGLLSLAAGVGLAIYGKYVLKKLKNISYL